MLIDIHFDVVDEKVRIWSDAAQFEQEIYNTILLDTDRNKIYAIGRRAEDIAADSPEIWANRPSTFKFLPAFSVSHFELSHAQAVLKFYSFVIHSEIRSLIGGLFWGRYDKLQFNIQLDEYEQIDKSIRERFEQGIFKLRMGHNAKAYSLKINSELPVVG